MASGDLEMEVSIYVLYGTWHSDDGEGAGVLGISVDVGTLMERLAGIAGSRAAGYAELQGHIQEERGDRYYEAVDGGWRYARFHISEHRLAIPEMAAEETGKGEQKEDG